MASKFISKYDRVNPSRFRKYLEARGLGEGTIKVYFYYLNHLVCPISQDTVNEFLSEHSNKTARGFVRNVIDFKQLRRIEIPKQKIQTKKTRLKYLSKPEVIHFIEALSEENEEQFLLKLIFLLKWTGGMRVSEVLSLKPSDINIVSREILVRHAKADSTYTVSFPKQIKDLLVKLKKRGMLEKKEKYDDEVFIFKGYSRYKIYYLTRKYGKEILGKHIHPHMLKHSYMMYLRSLGFDSYEIQKAGHQRSPLSTLKYIEAGEEERVKQKIGKVKFFD